ncbi:putative Glycosyltransferase involved in cell wall biogenesis [Vibrio cholerae]|uniref:glycosyltransferase family 2 protein n=1 Tax=Vibrio cholerae TaxID=666 RepID=UPI00204825B7|nr:glycosyltransferase [Vibrio cholerae]EMA2410235.1 glycosyltransferase family 2 protein [Vibrio cholerae]MDV2351556.1 glycosyltransferase [Vibrio cholerae]BCN19090.1 putative glycosyltransferase [Vibrio cholerae]GIA68376.1 putative Glycosyltransferase involved in cell wall biogenesis [Vibrio cholerae]
MKKINLSVGILSYKRTDLLLDTIDCLIDSSYEFELIVLNNNDFCILDELNSKLQGVNNAHLKYIFPGENLGVSLGRNRVVNECSGDFLILLDDDVHLENFDLIAEQTIKEFSSDNTLGAIAFNILEYSTGHHNRFEIPHKNKCLDMSQDFYTYLIIGAGNALRVSAVRSVGNFAKDFGLYGFEEIDVAFRLISEGYKIKYKSNCKILHKKSPDGRFSGKLVNKLYFENRTRMAKRYLKKRHYIVCFFVRFIFLLYKTKDVKLAASSFLVVVNDSESRKFDDVFFNYIKKVKGFLWY